MSKSLKPSLEDIRTDLSFLNASDLPILSGNAFKAMMYFIHFLAADRVWTYIPPGNRGLPDEDERLARIAYLDISQWKACRHEVEPFFIIKDGRWWLRQEDWITIEEPRRREPLPNEIREIVRARDGDQCAYCGTLEGPFHVDHIVPVTEGGADSLQNLTLACAECNASKGAMLAVEWLSQKFRAE